MPDNKLLFILITIISIIAVVSYLASPVFNLRNIHINKLYYISKSEIKNKLNFYDDKNIWLVTSTNVCKKILANKYVESVDIRKKYPDTLRVDITERIPVAKINNNGKFTVFTADGFILEEGAMKTSSKVPLLIGSAYTFSGTKLQFPAETKKIVQALKEIDRNARTNINKIIINDQHELKLVLNVCSRAEVYMGKLEEIERKFKVYSSIYSKISTENINIDYIDLRVVDKPVIHR